MASWNAPTIYAAGSVLSVTAYNNLANDATFLYQAPYAMAYDSTGTGVTSAAVTQINLQGTTANGHGMLITANEIVVPLTGIYSVSGTVAMPLAGAGVAGTLLYHNGAAFAESLGAVAVAETVTYPVSGLVSCSALDTLTLYGYQTSGSPLTTVVGAAVTYLHAFFVGSV